MRAHRDYGLTGIRGEAAAGFPSIQTPLLALCSLPEADLDARRLLEALFEIMREPDDTTLVRRGGIEALQSVKRCARICSRSGALCQASWRDALHTVDREFVARRLSPGGAADCLSVMLFLSGSHGSSEGQSAFAALLSRNRRAKTPYMWCIS